MEAVNLYKYRFGKLLEFMQAPGRKLDLIEDGTSGPITHSVTCVSPPPASADLYTGLSWGDGRTVGVRVPATNNSTSIAHGASVSILLEGMPYTRFHIIGDTGAPRIYSWAGRIKLTSRTLKLDVAGTYFRETVKPLVDDSIDVVIQVPELRRLIMEYYGRDEWEDDPYHPSYQFQIMRQP